MKRTVAIVSTAIPPSASGQAKVLDRLLRHRQDVEYVFFSDNYVSWPEPHAQTMGRYYQLGFQRFGLTMRKLPGLFGAINTRLGINRPIWRRAEEIAATMKDSPPAVIIGCSGNPYDLPAAARAAEILGASFVAYLFDDPVYQNPPDHTRELARRLEPFWAGRAAAIICPNEVLGAAIRSRTGRPVIIIPNPAGALGEHVQLRDRAAIRPLRIAYTGSVYEAQADSLKRLADVVNSRPDEFQLAIYSSQASEAIARLGINGRAVTHHAHLGDDVIAQVRSRADVLFLPLAFADAMRPIVDTSSPGKIADYLMSNVPILVHAPSSSYLSKFFRSHDAGLVVDDPSMKNLENGIQVLTEDVGQSARFRANALEAAKLFDATRVGDKFWRLIDPIMATSKVASRRQAGLLLVGRPDDPKFAYWAKSLERSPWTVRVFSTRPDDPGRSGAETHDSFSSSPVADAPTVSLVPDAISLPMRIIRAAMLAVFDFPWAVRRIIHGPVASLGSGRSLNRNQDNAQIEQRGVVSISPVGQGAPGLNGADLTEMSFALHQAIKAFEPEIIHSFDEASSNVVQTMMARAGRVSAIWLTSNWSLPSAIPWTGRPVVESLLELSSLTPCPTDHGSALERKPDRELSFAGISKFQQLRPRQARQLTHRLYSYLLRGRAV